MAVGSLEVDRLLSKLQDDLDEPKLSLPQKQETLERIKVLGRDVNNAGPIFSQKGIRTLSRYGLDQDPSDVSREALRALANALLLNESSRQTFVDLGYGPKAASRLKVDNRDDEFLISRILFLLTYNTRIDFEALVRDNDLAENINEHVSNHAKGFSKANHSRTHASQMDDMALAETLKLIFNITYYYPSLVSSFTCSVGPIADILVHYPLARPSLQPPITYILNALLNLNLTAVELRTATGQETSSRPLFSSTEPEQVVVRLIAILDHAIQELPEKELDQAAAPLCTLLRRSYELADSPVKSRMQQLLLPTEEDREKPLGQGETLASRLLRLSCSPNLPTLRENISNLLFELSDKDATKFIQNIGYGFAAGFLMSHDIQIPINATDTGSSTQGDATDVQAFNPITGQRFSAEDQDKADGRAEMTEQEKEHEAERLYVLFERLKATGVVDVKNPVEQAIEEGRFEELD